jgi:hypothetical protein
MVSAQSSEATKLRKDPLRLSITRKAKGAPPNDDPKVPILASSPKKVSKKDQLYWYVPPCISSWKNPRGYTYSLDKRVNKFSDPINVSISKFGDFKRCLDLAEKNIAIQRSAKREFKDKFRDIKRRMGDMKGPGVHPGRVALEDIKEYNFLSMDESLLELCDHSPFNKKKAFTYLTNGFEDKSGR